MDTSFFHKDKWRATRSTVLIVSLFSSLLLVFTNYMSNNIAFPFFDDIEEFTWLEYFRRNVHQEEMRNDVCYINIAYDKTLIPYSNNEWGILEGNIDNNFSGCFCMQLCKLSSSN